SGHRTVRSLETLLVVGLRASFLFGWRRRGLPEGWGVGPVDQGFGAFGRQGFPPIDRALNIVFPHLARQFVEKFDAVAVRIVDIDAMRHAMVDAPIEL